MPLYICIQCHVNHDIVGHPTPTPRCGKCRYPLRYFGREYGEISESAREFGPFPNPVDDARVRSKTLTIQRPSPAVLEAETQLTYRPDDPEILHFLALHALSDREWRRAIGLIERLLVIVPDHQVMQQKLIEALLLDHRGHEAEVALAQYLVNHNDDALAHYNMVVAIGFGSKDISRMRAHADACEVLSGHGELGAAAWQLVTQYSGEIRS